MWRMRTIIWSEVNITPSEVKHGNVEFRVFEINEENTEGGNCISASHRYCDAFLADENITIDEAFSLLYDRLQGLLDRLSLISYGQSYLKTILSICPATVSVGQEFQIAIPQYRLERKTVPASLDLTLPLANLSDASERWIRLLRFGLNSASEEDRYISYYSLLEEVARAEGTEKIATICINCNFKTDTGRPATQNFIKDILLSHNIDEELTKQAPKYRNKIAHGGALKNREFYRNLAKLNSHLEEVCLIELEKRLYAPILNRINAHIIDIPVVIHTAFCDQDGSFELIQTTQTVPTRFIRLSGLGSDLANQSVLVGMPLGQSGEPLVDPYSWPECVC